MNLFNLAKILDKKISALRIEPNLCTQTISPKSSCQSCIDACPTNSISIANRKIEIDDNCVECGLCSTVCPTNAIFAQRPSVPHILDEVARKCKEQDQVYLQCQKQASKASQSWAVKVPCLGMLPREAWLTLLNQYDNLSIFHSENSCDGCQMTKGYEIWQKELHVAEEMSGRKIQFTTAIQRNEKKANYDQNRRELFSLFASEVKSTNKLVVKEMLGDAKVRTFEEKLQEDSVAKVQREWEAISTGLAEKLTNEAVQPFMVKRKLLLKEVGGNANLQERKDIRLPSIDSECTFCGACSLLCPTDALVQEKVDGQTMITLHPYKCVDCHLCEDICYPEYIKLHPASNQRLLHEQTILAIEKI